MAVENPADVLTWFKGIQPMHMNDQALERLTNLSGGLDAVTEINARGGTVTDQGLARLERLPALQKLALDGTRITDAGLASLQKVPSLMELSLNSTGVTSTGLTQLAALPALKRLELMGCDLTLDDFAAVGRLPALETLVLNQVVELTDPGFDLICEARTLKVLMLNGCTGLTDRGLPSLAKLTALEELWLNKANLNGVGFREAVGKGGLKNLKSLYLSSVPINPSGAKAVNSLKSLETLDISYIMGMNDAGVVEFTEGMRNLKWLSIEGSKGVQGAAFSKMKATAVSLETLNAQNSGLIDQGLTYLKPFRKLTFVDLGNTGVSITGVEQLKRLIPTCTIHYGGMKY